MKNFIVAEDANYNRVFADEAISGEYYSCPVCHQEVRPRKPSDKIPHYFHINRMNKKNRNTVSMCTDDKWHYDMTQWHYEWQRKFSADNSEIVFESNGKIHRADVVVGNTVIEFQHSKIKIEEFRERNRFYTELGYQVIWVFDVSEQYDEDCIVQNEDCIDSEYHWGKNRPGIFKEMVLRSEDCTVYLEFNGIVHGIYAASRKFGVFYIDYKRQFSFDEFVAYINEKANELSIAKNELLIGNMRKENREFNTLDELWTNTTDWLVVRKKGDHSEYFIKHNEMGDMPRGVRGVFGCKTWFENGIYVYGPKLQLNDSEEPVWKIKRLRNLNTPIIQNHNVVEKTPIEGTYRYIDIQPYVVPIGEYSLSSLINKIGKENECDFIAYCKDNDKYYLFKHLYGSAYNEYEFIPEKSCYIDIEKNDFVWRKLKYGKWYLLSDSRTDKPVMI